METEREDATRAEKTTSQEEVGDRCGAPEDPSAERLDDGACDGIGEGGEDGRESAGRSRRGQRRRRAVIIAAVVLIILGFGAGAWILSEAASVGEEAAGPDGSKDASEETVAVAFSVEADGWTEGSSPFLAHITGETSDGDAVDFWHAVWPDGTGSVVELPAGTYRISWTSAINADGSIYRVPGELTVGAGDTEIGGSFEQVPAEDVTQDDLDQILGEIGEAVGNGDETLSGDAGQGVIDSATENAGNNPNADKEEIEQAGEEASGNVSEEPQTPSGTGSSSGSGSGSGSTGGSSSSGGSTGADRPPAPAAARPRRTRTTGWRRPSSNGFRTPPPTTSRCGSRTPPHGPRRCRPARTSSARAVRRFPIRPSGTRTIRLKVPETSIATPSSRPTRPSTTRRPATTRPCTTTPRAITRP